MPCGTRQKRRSNTSNSRRPVGEQVRSSINVWYRVEPLDNNVALGFVDAHPHIKSAIVKLFVEYFRIPVQPTDTGAVRGLDREVQRDARCCKALFNGRQQQLDALPC